MGKSSAPAQPAPPDPYATSAAQTAGDVQSAVANAYLGNANVISPYGSSTYSQTGTQQIRDAQGRPIDVPTFTQRIDLSPDQQNLLNQQNQLSSTMNTTGINQLNRVSNLLSSPLDTSGVPQVQTGVGSGPRFTNPADAPNMRGSFDPGQAVRGSFDPGQSVRGNVNLSNAPTTFGAAGNIQKQVGPNDFSADRLRVEEGLYSRLNPQLERDRLGLENRLQNQGIVQGSEAWDTAIDTSNQQANDARMQVIRAGGDEQSRLYGLDLSRGQFANQAQQQGYDQNLGRGTFAQQGTALNNQAALSSGEFANQAAAQMYGQNQGLAAFGNQAAAQMYGQNQEQAAFANQAAQQNYANQQAGIDARNQLAQQGYTNQLQGATFANQAAQQALQQQLALRNQPLNEISALMGGGQVTLPQFSGYNAPQVGPSTIGANINQNAALANSQWQTQANMAAQNNAGLYGLGSAALGAGGRMLSGGTRPWFLSDRRVKRDDTIIGAHNGLPLHSFRYIWDDDDVPLRVGFMAQEVEAVMPEAVVDIGPIKAVNYAMVM